MLWQADLKYGPYLPDPNNPQKKRRTYLMAFIDDYSRLVPHAQFYFEQRLPVLEDCFKKAILKRDPDTVYVDNGKIFVSRWFRIACARLNIRHVNTKPYSPQAKGKIERFLGTVDQFVAEVKLLNPKTLEELNAAFACWLEESYNHKDTALWKHRRPVSPATPGRSGSAAPKSCGKRFCGKTTGRSMRRVVSNTGTSCTTLGRTLPGKRSRSVLTPSPRKPWRYG